MAAGHAIGRGAPVAGAAALDARPRQRGRRAGHRAQQPRAARGASSASRTAATSRSTRSWPAACTGSPASTRCGATSPRAPQDVPGAIVRAYHEAETGRGPAIVIVPMDDWLAPAPEPHEVLGPERLLRSAGRRPGRRRRRSRTCSGRPARPRIVGAAPTRRLERAHRARRAARLPGLPGAVRRPGRLPAGPSAVRRPPARPPRAAARGARRRTTSCSSSAPARCASTRSTRARW